MSQLEELLKEALSGDKAAFQIYLDLLEQEDPHFRRELSWIYAEENTRVNRVIRLLTRFSERYRSIKRDDRGIHVPYRFTSIGFGDIGELNVRYPDFSYSRSAAPEFESLISQKPISIENVGKVKSFVLNSDGEIQMTLEPSAISRVLVSEDRQFQTALALIIEKADKVDKDIEDLDYILAIPKYDLVQDNPAQEPPADLFEKEVLSFVRQANSTQCDLLSAAFTGDKGAWSVFLDHLRETRPLTMKGLEHNLAYNDRRAAFNLIGTLSFACLNIIPNSNATGMRMYQLPLPINDLVALGAWAGHHTATNFEFETFRIEYDPHQDVSVFFKGQKPSYNVYGDGEEFPIESINYSIEEDLWSLYFGQSGVMRDNFDPGITEFCVNLYDKIKDKPDQACAAILKLFPISLGLEGPAQEEEPLEFEKDHLQQAATFFQALSKQAGDDMGDDIIHHDEEEVEEQPAEKPKQELPEGSMGRSLQMAMQGDDLALTVFLDQLEETVPHLHARFIAIPFSTHVASLKPKLEVLSLACPEIFNYSYQGFSSDFFPGGMKEIVFGGIILEVKYDDYNVDDSGERIRIIFPNPIGVFPEVGREKVYGIRKLNSTPTLRLLDDRSRFIGYLRNDQERYDELNQILVSNIEKMHADLQTLSDRLTPASLVKTKALAATFSFLAQKLGTEKEVPELNADIFLEPTDQTIRTTQGSIQESLKMTLKGDPLGLPMFLDQLEEERPEVREAFDRIPDGRGLIGLQQKLEFLRDFFPGVIKQGDLAFFEAEFPGGIIGITRTPEAFMVRYPGYVIEEISARQISLQSDESLGDVNGEEIHSLLQSLETSRIVRRNSKGNPIGIYLHPDADDDQKLGEFQHYASILNERYQKMKADIKTLEKSLTRDKTQTKALGKIFETLLHKFANSQAEDLLKSAIANLDRETYAIFLDRLEEEYPHIRKKIEPKSSPMHSFGVCLRYLSEIFPNVIAPSGDGFRIETDNPAQIGALTIGEASDITYEDNHWALFHDMDTLNGEIYFQEASPFEGFNVRGWVYSPEQEQINLYVTGLGFATEISKKNYPLIYPKFKEKAESLLLAARNDFQELMHLFQVPRHRSELLISEPKEILASFQKLANDHSASLLKQTLLGDNSSFLIFLDLLEETNPHSKNILLHLPNAPDLQGIYPKLNDLADLCPSVIRRNETTLEFQTPAIGGMTAIHNSYGFSASYGDVKGSITRILFRVEFAKGKSIEGAISNVILYDISRFLNDPKILRLGFKEDGQSYSQSINDEDPDYQLYEGILDGWFKKMDSDFKELAEALRTPDTKSKEEQDKEEQIGTFPTDSNNVEEEAIEPAKTTATLCDHLKAALQDDRDSFLVFLDQLEEEDEVGIHFLREDSLKQTLNTLSVLCPNLIEIQNEGHYSFTTPALGRLVSIKFGFDTIMEYRDAIIARHEGHLKLKEPVSLNKITGLAPAPVSEIRVNLERGMIRFFGPEGNGILTLHENSSAQQQYAKALSFFDLYGTRAQIDEEDLTALLKMPEKTNYKDELNPFPAMNEKDDNQSDDTDAARKALNLSGTKYPNDMAGEAVLPDGRKVRLLPSPANNKATHRLQIECPSCKKWMPAGRTAQHRMSCLKKNDPDSYELEMSERKRLKEIQNRRNEYYRGTTGKSRQEILDAGLVFSDFLEEQRAPNAAEGEREILYWRIAGAIADEEFGFGKTFVKQDFTENRGKPFPWIYEVFDRSNGKMETEYDRGGRRLAILSVNRDGSYEMHRTHAG